MNATHTGIEIATRGPARVLISAHAYERARERLHWSRTTVARMALRALMDGSTADRAGGVIGRLLEGIAYPGSDCCPVLHGEFVYIFGCDEHRVTWTLLTLYRAPSEILRLVVKRSVHRAFEHSFGEN
jgi:hypothetical protein